MDQGRAKVMRRVRPKALVEEDDSFWETDAPRSVPPLLDFKEAKDYHERPLELPNVIPAKAGRRAQPYRRY